MSLLVLCLSLALGAAILALVCHCWGSTRINQLSQLLWVSIFLLTLILALQVAPTQQPLFTLSSFQSYSLNLSLQIDALSKIMLVLVSFFACIIQAYSSRYLYSDHNQARFMGQLSLLCFSVMLLVVSGGLLTAFIAWQLIGLSLYFLLNHYHYNVKANKSAKKKYIINRLGDVAFLLAVMLCLKHYGSTDFTVLRQAQVAWPIPALLIIAVATKSAQFPFHIWLIDSMEAPTPVSALMHAGVINSGGFLLTRLSYLYSAHEALLMLLVVMGLSTALLGAFFMRYQTDIKKRLAYSTMAQMGFMVLQCGLGCYISAIFHLIAHGFFKATMFLNQGTNLQQRTIKQQANKFNWPRLIVAMLLALAACVVGDWYLRTQGFNLHRLLWVFLFLTLAQVSYNLLNNFMIKGLLVTVASMAALFVAYAVYLLLLSSLAESLSTVVPEKMLTLNSTLLAIGGASLVFGFLLLSRYGRINWQAKLFSLGFYKADVEFCFRHFLLNPMRQIGDSIMNLLVRLSFAWQLLLLAGLWLLFAYAPLSSLVKTSIILALAIVLLLAANRSFKLKRLLVCLGIFLWLLGELCFSLNSLHASNYAWFHWLNMGSIVVAAAILLYQRSLPQSDISLIHNRLPWCHFYLVCFLVLILGLPGTASFISELYLFSALSTKPLVLTLLFALLMIMLAIVILHALQDHFFNPLRIRQHAIAMTPGLHALSLLAIGFNVFNGIFPDVLLHGLY